jgi:hypothetical protein
MTEEARQARNAYKREWYKKNPGKRAEYEERYWRKQAERAGNAPAKEAEKGRV